MRRSMLRAYSFRQQKASQRFACHPRAYRRIDHHLRRIDNRLYSEPMAQMECLELFKSENKLSGADISAVQPDVVCAVGRYMYLVFLRRKNFTEIYTK